MRMALVKIKNLNWLQIRNKGNKGNKGAFCKESSCQKGNRELNRHKRIHDYIKGYLDKK